MNDTSAGEIITSDSSVVFQSNITLVSLFIHKKKENMCINIGFNLKYLQIDFILILPTLTIFP